MPLAFVTSSSTFFILTFLEPKFIIACIYGNEQTKLLSMCTHIQTERVLRIIWHFPGISFFFWKYKTVESENSGSKYQSSTVTCLKKQPQDGNIGVERTT